MTCRRIFTSHEIVLPALALVAAVFAAAYMPSSSAASDSASGQQLIVAAFGGAYGKAEQEAYFKPFTKATGIEVRVLPAQPSLAQIKLQVQSNNVLWDIAELGPWDTYNGCRDELLTPVDYQLVRKSDLAPEAGTRCGIIASLYTEGIGYKKSMFKTPPTWQDFFDVKKYPGKRAMEKYLQDGTLEAAVVGTGVPLDQIYPLDVEKAIAAMSSLGSDLILVDSLAQASQLLQSGSVVMIQTAIGRILPLESQGYAISLVGQRGPSFFTIPKGARNTTVAQKFLAFITSCKECTATMERMTAYGGPNKDGIQLVSEERRKLLPYDPEVQKNTWAPNLEWWGENAEAAQEAFQRFQVTGH